MKMVNFKLTFVVSLFALLATSGCYSSPPSDKSMEERFRSHEADFNKVVNMLKEDSKVEIIDLKAAYLPGNEPRNTRPKAELSPQRLEEYHRLLQQINVQEVRRHADKSMAFAVWTNGDGFYERTIDPPSIISLKDYLYTETPPSPVVDSLNEPEKLLKGSSESSDNYKKIADNWYLHYSECCR